MIYDGSYAPLQGQEVSEAYRSAVDISLDVKAGLLIRQTHHWAALVFVAAILVHMLRVFFTGASGGRATSTGWSGSRLR